MNWLTNIPTSALDIDRKQARKEIEQKNIQAKAPKIGTKMPEIKSSHQTKSSYTSYTQSLIGQAADIAVFGVPLGVFK
ncbi:hypothetical protein ESCO10_00003 [Escherichia phage vB_EcoM_ESCO10]|nr:hypothetical protein ESCO10_00003 [Escherichia phage vB_EcoM_ESCO10]